MPEDGPPVSPPPGADPQKVAEGIQLAKDVARAPKEQTKAVRLAQSMFLSEVQLLLAEKRTAYALLRTGVTVSLLPLSIWTVLIATSSLWNLFEILWLLVFLMAVALSLFALGVYLIVHALEHVRHADRALAKLRTADTVLEELLYHERRWRRRASA